MTSPLLPATKPCSPGPLSVAASGSIDIALHEHACKRVRALPPFCVHIHATMAWRPQARPRIWCVGTSQPPMHVCAPMPASAASPVAVASGASTLCMVQVRALWARPPVSCMLVPPMPTRAWVAPRHQCVVSARVGAGAEERRDAHPRWQRVGAPKVQRHRVRQRR